MSVCDQSFVDTYGCPSISQYRESKNLTSLLSGAVGTLDDIRANLCEKGDWPSLATAEGDHLDHYGNFVGLPRCVCSAQTPTYFGFSKGCDPDPCNCASPVLGFCSSWKCAGVEVGARSYCFTDDDLYRRFIKGKAVANSGIGRVSDVEETISAIFDTKAYMLSSDNGQITVGISRLATAEEMSLLPLIRNIVPIFPSVKFNLSFSKTEPFGFGMGWGGFCGSFPTVC